MAKLAKLHLENFASLALIDINFQGSDGKIIGQNRIGKTTILNAICYLLTDKLLGGSSDIPAIKPHGNTRAKVVVEGTFITKDGDVTLRKEFYEKWVRPRGSADEELQGHATDYFINGAKQARAKDFFEGIESKFGIPASINGLDVYQLVIDPFYLGVTICGSINWKNARKAIIDIVGDVSPEEIYAANKNAEIAKADLESHQFNDVEAKKAIRGEIDGYKKKTIANDGLRAEYTRVINLDATDEEYETAKAKSEEIDQQLAELRIGVANPYSNEVTALQAELFKLNEQYLIATDIPVDHSKSEGIRKNLQALRDKLNKLTLEERSNTFEVNRVRQDLQAKHDLQVQYKKQLQDLQDRSKAIMVDIVCPTCGQNLPEEKIEEAFNKKKAELIEEAMRVRDMALKNKQSIEFSENTLANIESRSFAEEIAKTKLDIAEAETDLAEATQEERDSIKAPDPGIQKRIAEINARLAQIHQLTAQGADAERARIEDMKARKNEYQATISKRISAEHARKRIAEISAEDAKNGKAMSDAEQRHWAVGEFVKTKLELLDKHMADKLGEVRFQLIKENIKAGSYDEVCVPYIIDPFTEQHTNTLFDDGSKSEQIYTGIRIIKAIRDAKGWEPLPIIFDQGGELDARSSYKAAYDAEAQIIAVKVEGDANTPTFVPFTNN